jgi:N-acetylneuraminic acid mutarotase
VGVYGIKGSPSASNIPGGRRHAISWADSSGKLWLFGGEGYDSTGNWDYLNDLWRFDPTTLEWTWISGSELLNQPGEYGTKGAAAASNVPGARYQSVSWIDRDGRLWLFGGYGFATSGSYGWLNDLWRYDPTTAEWTWVSGSNTVGQAGVYGTKGLAAPTNIPGARKQAVSWIDSSGGFWLYGGNGFGLLGDLWKFDPGSHYWIWESGTSTAYPLAVYGTRGIAASANTPGSRADSISWIDASGRLWLFGGDILSATLINDLWMYDRTSQKWTWVSGSNTASQSGTYGTKGIASSSNIPGARFGAVSWIDSQGRLWLFGGWGFASGISEGLLNDLWHHTR